MPGGCFFSVFFFIASSSFLSFFSLFFRRKTAISIRCVSMRPICNLTDCCKTGARASATRAEDRPLVPRRLPLFTAGKLSLHDNIHIHACAFASILPFAHRNDRIHIIASVISSWIGHRMDRRRKNRERGSRISLINLIEPMERTSNIQPVRT